MVEVSPIPVFIFLFPFIYNGASGNSPVVKVGDSPDCIYPSHPCPLNEDPGCRPPCPPETCITLYVAYDCVANQTCVRGCFCKPGYLRTTTNGTCIPHNQCLPLECVEDPNAKKGCGNRCGKTCADYKIKNIHCPARPCKKNGCDCKDGLIYDKNVERCVKPSECTKQCTKPHERYSSCLLGECVPKTCEDLGKPLACPAIAPPCAGGCICEEGYVRDAKGNCRDKKTCPSCGGDPNAVSGCGNPCGNTCDSLNKTDLVCPQYCETNGCDCKKGFALNTITKKCTPIKDCPKPPRVCPKNEQPGCRKPCPPETCVSLYAAFRCKENQTCIEGCFCKPGYLRTTTNGTCVLRDRCLPLECVNDPNATKGCGDRCGKTCADYKDKNKICPARPCKKNGCDCKYGLVYDTNVDRCVKPSECTKQCTKPHERYSSCLLGECVPKTCEDLGKPLACPAIAPPCAGGCICEEGYVRDAKGNCRDKKTCSNQCGANEQYYCGPSCPEASCNNPNPPICINKRCEYKCFCKKGYLRDANKKCIPADKCPIICNKPHERYIDCLAGQCNPKTCDDLGKSIPCPSRAGPCPGGCMCDEGYLTDSNGACIKQEKCPPKPCGTNQTWVTTCNGLCPDSFCPRNDQPLPPCEPLLPCYPGCQCKLNYRLNRTRSCILAPDCPPVKCTRQNEVWNSCPSTCLAENCEDVNKQPTTCNTLIWLCSPRCICAKGYFRNRKGLCIPAAQCRTYLYIQSNSMEFNKKVNHLIIPLY